MEKTNILIGIVLILIIGIIAYLTLWPRTIGGIDGAAVSTQSNQVSSTEIFKAISTGSTDQGDVAIELTPRGVINGKLIIDFAANTHSVSLEQFDLKKITTLEHEGKIIKPSEASYLSGHHPYGSIAFDIGKEEAESFIVKIKGIPNIEERIFKWEAR